MPQFDVFPHPIESVRRVYPLAVSLRSDLITGGDEGLIAPLIPRSRMPGAVGRLSPVVEIDSEEYMVLIERITTLPVRELPRRIANLSRYRDALLGAVDLLFFGA
jgi:hypothetical protein